MSHNSKNCGRKKTIYSIQDYNDVVGYIGQTSNVERRFARHLDPSRRMIRKVDRWIASAGGVTFGILEVCDWCIAGKQEVKWKKRLRPVVMD